MNFIILQFPGVLAYCMSKSAIDQFTRCVALGKVAFLIHPYVFKMLRVCSMKYVMCSQIILQSWPQSKYESTLLGKLLDL